MSTVSYKEVCIVIATTVEAPERFKLREALIGYLPYPYTLTGFLLTLFLNALYLSAVEQSDFETGLSSLKLFVLNKMLGF